MTLDLQDPPATNAAGGRATALLSPPAAAASHGAAKPPVLLRATAVGKQYHLWDRPSSRLWFSLLSRSHRTLRGVLPAGSPTLAALGRKRDQISHGFTALENISFELRRGESLGIIGRNGSGKSTLLQIIAGTLCPSVGKVEVHGRVAALLELGSGFNMEFTGRENVYLNASILGLSREEIDAHFDDIATFADIGEFMGQPVKTYSSGMLLRLAFAVQVAVEPDLFIVDEALAVGDVYFQSKCYKLLRQKLDAGMTLLLVSHDASSVRTLCQRALVLDHGRVAFLGASDEAINVYHAINSGALAVGHVASGVAEAAGGGAGERSSAGSATRQDETPESAPSTEIGREDTAIPELVLEQAAAAIPRGIEKFQDEIGDGTLMLTGCALFNSAGQRAESFVVGEPIRIGITFETARDFAAGELVAGFQVRDRFNQVVSASTTLNCGLELPALRANGRYVMMLRVRGRLGPGKYLFDFGLGTESDHAGSASHYCHRIAGIAAFQVDWFGRKVMFQGSCDLGTEFSSVQLAGSVAKGGPLTQM